SILGTGDYRESVRSVESYPISILKSRKISRNSGNPHKCYLLGSKWWLTCSTCQDDVSIRLRLGKSPTRLGISHKSQTFPAERPERPRNEAAGRRISTQ